ncbi:unnamed protein product [Blepharisma stoltei]|uniref:Uncharacterized protein n=1 Tax=Blepharisma stoltei TaxID=1481888 RepID=A0AAU9IQ29_9CILI|nr:unnamed protein product [Blepharisma stoltei]
MDCNMSSQDDIYEKDSLIDAINNYAETENLLDLFGTLKELEELRHEQFILLTFNAFQRLLWNQNLDGALHMLDLFPFLCFYDKCTEQMLIEYLFDLVSRGEIDSVKHIIDSFGIYIHVVNSSKYNLFEHAASSGQYEMMIVLHKELGLSSDESFLLDRAARLDRADILEYLWREVGITPNRSEILIKSAVKGGSIESLKFIRFVMGITDFKEHSILEVAISSSVAQGSTEVLDFLITYFRMIFNPKKLFPLGETEPTPKSCLVNSLTRAAYNGNIDFIRYYFYIVKLDFATDNPNSEWAGYLKLLQIAVKKGDLNLLKCLIEEIGIDIKLLPDAREDSLIFTILKRSGDKKTKKMLLSYALNFESKDNIKYFKCMLDPEQLDLLKKMRYTETNGYCYKRIKRGLWA